VAQVYFDETWVVMYYVSVVYDNNLDGLTLLHSKLKCLRFLSLLIRLSVYQTQASLLDVLITFVNTFHFNLVVIFVCFTFVCSEVNLIYLKQLIITLGLSLTYDN